MIKLISIDVDGTLLDSQGNLPMGNTDPIKKAKQKGIHIILNTGKPIGAIEDPYHILGLDDPVVTLTGGLVLENHQNRGWKMVRGSPIPTSTFAMIYQAVKDMKISTHFLTENITYIHHAINDVEYLEEFDEAMRKFSCMEYCVVPVSPLVDWAGLEMPPYKIMFFSDDKEEIERVWSALNGANIPGIISEYSSPRTVDVRTTDSGKKNAVIYLCHRYGIDRSEVMALGDHESDIELIQWAGIGAFMENGDQKYKAQAPLLAPSNDACGVATIIEKYALK